MRAVNLLPEREEDRDRRRRRKQRQRRAHDDARRDRRRQRRGDRARLRRLHVRRRPQRRRRQAARSLAAIERQVDEARSEAAAEIQQNQQQVASAGRRPSLSSDVKAQLDTFNVASAQRIQWDVLLSDLSRVIPAGSWLSSLTLQGQTLTTPDPAAQQTTTPPLQTTPTGFVASGFALSQERVVRLLQQLEARADALRHHAAAQRARDVGTDKAFQFTLSANVRLDRVS